MKAFRLPPDLMLGATGSAAQIEGGNVHHTWNSWERCGRIRPEGGTLSIRQAARHFENWKEDVDIAAGLGIETLRFSVEWARIQPEEGVIDREAAARYREEIEYMKQRGIRPLLTIHHFTDPVWFEKKGAFLKPANVRSFLKYVGVVVNLFGDLVSDYVTFNEPNVYALMGYMGRGFPPDRDDPAAARRVLSVMAGCHIRAYEKIHRMREAMGYRDTKVGFALQMRSFAPLHPASGAERTMADLSRFLFQEVCAKAFLRGDFRFPLENLGGFSKGEYGDYLGISYSTRSHVVKIGDNIVGEGAPRTDSGREIYPHGLEECMRELYGMMNRPVWILENGCCDNTDSFRALFIYDHLAVTAASKIPVERYYYGTLLDGFEWLAGTGEKYGLVGVDPETGERTVRESGHFYREIIRLGGVTEELADRVLSGMKYHT